MSADLFAEFSSTSCESAAAPEPAPDKPPSRSSTRSQARGLAQDLTRPGRGSDNLIANCSTSQEWLIPHFAPSGAARPFAAIHRDAVDDDVWGDFEMAQSMTHMVEQSVTSRPPTIQTRSKAASIDANVLFDVDNLEPQDGENADDADDFGDFEVAAAPPMKPRSHVSPASNPAASLNLLEFDDPQISADGFQASPYLVKPKSLGLGTMSPDDTKKRKYAAMKVSNTKATRSDTDIGNYSTAGSEATTVKGKVAFAADENCWPIWNDAPCTPAFARPVAGNKQSHDSWDWGVQDNSNPPEPARNTIPPKNVPPPSVILSGFPDLFRSGNLLFKPIAGQEATVRQRILSDPTSVQFLQSYILLGTTAGRIIAGRKHRWRRDKLLAQKTSLSASGSRGLKLTGLDKAQSARDDREAADVVAAWKEHIGWLRAAVATAKSGGETNLQVPELSEKMAIQTAKMVLTARSACLICGLKRDERIAKVDFEVEDSFGEWWVEHWGHRACTNFWLEYEQRFRQR